MSVPGKTSLSKTFFCLATVTALFFTVSVSTQGPGQGQGPAQVPPGLERINGRDAAAAEVLVRFNRTLPEQALAALEAQVDAGQREMLADGVLMRFQSRRFDVETLVAFFSQLPEVEYAEPNYILTSIAAPDDSLFGNLWALDNTQNPAADISAVPAWEVSTGSASIVTGVIDTGIDYTHPDLAANVWSAPAEFTVTFGPTSSITCAAGTHGYNAVRNTCDPADDHNHGSHVSGTIGATGNNGAGVVGVNWTTRMMGLKFLAANGSGSTANAIKTIEFAIQAKARFGAAANVRILSNSWGGGGFSQSLLNAINKANTFDMLFVAAAGNDGTNNDTAPHYPSSYDAPNVVSVASTTNTDGRSSFSNYGATSVDLGAPGSGILSTVRNGQYATFSGTSMATPHVSGAAALMLAVCSLNTADLKATILSTVDPIASMANITVTGGRLNVDRAIRDCSDAGDPEPTAPPVPGNLQATGGDAQVALSWSSSTGATSYAVRRRVLGEVNYTEIAAGLTGTNHLDTNVVNGTTYQYVVTASANGLESAQSGMASATPAAPAPPTTPVAPTGVKAQANGKNQITVSWFAVSGATSYKVMRSATSGGSYTVVGTVTGTSFQNTGLLSKTTYFYVVVAANESGESPNSAVVSARTK